MRSLFIASLLLPAAAALAQTTTTQPLDVESVRGRITKLSCRHGREPNLYRVPPHLKPGQILNLQEMLSGRRAVVIDRDDEDLATGVWTPAMLGDARPCGEDILLVQVDFGQEGLN